MVYLCMFLSARVGINKPQTEWNGMEWARSVYFCSEKRFQSWRWLSFVSLNFLTCLIFLPVRFGCVDMNRFFFFLHTITWLSPKNVSLINIIFVDLPVSPGWLLWFILHLSQVLRSTCDIVPQPCGVSYFVFLAFSCSVFFSFLFFPNPCRTAIPF